ncbi:hypothetical protein TRFO_23993 [Tritrichomonas foetus]|uniref:Trafficking protein particle complex subunit 13 C-terminal domain-containing protein n=1 Tax=Tritrichomonas foetus TaxID=1144522 RepID=A0A1J4K8I6_9EUKA|nr:hypothetical protein TRFO_23993 [Tritrichomonas foetus]|eukprot:OHT07719.1 hypothetical protein TRFO_23993 [Tritrichomonas foetus]
MSNKKPIGNVAKLSIKLCELPSIKTTARTSQFSLETLNGSNLHLPPPNPVFKERPNKVGNSGVPMYLMASITNTRFQPLRDCTLSVVVKHGTRTIYPTATDNQDKKPPQQVDPMKWLTFPLIVTCPVDGTLKATTRAQFTFENQKMDMTASADLKVDPSISMARSKPSNIVQIQVENKMKQLFLNVKARTPDKQTSFISRFLKQEEVASTFLKFNEAVPEKVEISWSIPSCQKCWQIISLDKLPEKKNEDLAISLSDVPQTIPALKPFKVTATLKNTRDEPISGELQFQKGDRVMHLIGKNVTRFVDIPAKSEIQMPFNFIALSQGAHPIPNIEVKIDGAKASYWVESSVGILVIGHDDE